MFPEPTRTVSDPTAEVTCISPEQPDLRESRPTISPSVQPTSETLQKWSGPQPVELPADERLAMLSGVGFDPPVQGTSSHDTPLVIHRSREDPSSSPATESGAATSPRSAYAGRLQRGTQKEEGKALDKEEGNGTSLLKRSSSLPTNTAESVPMKEEHGAMEKKDGVEGAEKGEKTANASSEMSKAAPSPAPQGKVEGALDVAVGVERDASMEVEHAEKSTEGEGDVQKAKGPKPRGYSQRHHLLRHVLPENTSIELILKHLEVKTCEEAVEKIMCLSQRELQASFEVIYNKKALSNNNQWLRKKLIDALPPVEIPLEEGDKRSPAGGQSQDKNAYPWNLGGKSQPLMVGEIPRKRRKPIIAPRDDGCGHGNYSRDISGETFQEVWEKDTPGSDSAREDGNSFETGSSLYGRKSRRRAAQGVSAATAAVLRDPELEALEREDLRRHFVRQKHHREFENITSQLLSLSRGKAGQEDFQSVLASDAGNKDFSTTGRRLPTSAPMGNNVEYGHGPIANGTGDSFLDHSIPHSAGRPPLWRPTVRHLSDASSLSEQNRQQLLNSILHANEAKLRALDEDQKNAFGAFGRPNHATSRPFPSQAVSETAAPWPVASSNDPLYTQGNVSIEGVLRQQSQLSNVGVLQSALKSILHHHHQQQQQQQKPAVLDNETIRFHGATEQGSRAQPLQEEIQRNALMAALSMQLKGSLNGNDVNPNAIYSQMPDMVGSISHGLYQPSETQVAATSFRRMGDKAADEQVNAYLAVLQAVFQQLQQFEFSGESQQVLQIIGVLLTHIVNDRQRSGEWKEGKQEAEGGNHWYPPSPHHHYHHQQQQEMVVQSMNTEPSDVHGAAFASERSRMANIASNSHQTAQMPIDYENEKRLQGMHTNNFKDASFRERIEGAPVGNAVPEDRPRQPVGIPDSDAMESVRLANALSEKKNNDKNDYVQNNLAVPGSSYKVSNLLANFLAQTEKN